MYKFIWDSQLNCYFAEHNPTIRADKNGNIFGGGGTSIETPATPAAPTTAESVQAYTENLPAMYKTQLEWAPQIEAQQYQTALQYAPQYTDILQQSQMDWAPKLAEQQMQLQQQYAPQYAAQAQELQQQYQPEAYAAKQALGGMMTPEYLSDAPFNVATDPTLQAMQGMATPEWMQGYQAQEAPGFLTAKDRVRQDLRGAWAGRGMAESGMSAEREAQAMAEMEYPYAMEQEALTQQVGAQRQQLGAQLGTQGLQSQQNAWQNYYTELGRRQNMGLSMAGYQTPAAAQVATPQVQTAQYQPQNLMQGYDYGTVQSGMQQGYGNYAGAYSSMYGANANLAAQGSPMGQIAGQLAGGIGTGVGTGFGGAWGQSLFGSSKRFKKNIRLWGKPSILSNN